MKKQSQSPAENAKKTTKSKATPPVKKATPSKWRAVSVKVEPPQVQDTANVLNALALRFVDEYLIDLNATQAYMRASPGVKIGTASAEGCKFLGNPKIAGLIAERKAQRAAKAGLTAERVLQEVARLALFDPRKLFGADGTPLAITDLDDDTAAALAGLDVQEVRMGDGGPAMAVVKKYKLADKGANLDRLMKHLGLFEKDNNQKVDPIAALLASIGKSSIPIVREPGNG